MSEGKILKKNYLRLKHLKKEQRKSNKKKYIYIYIYNYIFICMAILLKKTLNEKINSNNSFFVPVNDIPNPQSRLR